MPGPPNPRAPQGEGGDGVPAPRSTLKSLVRSCASAQPVGWSKIPGKPWRSSRRSQKSPPREQHKPGCHSPVELTPETTKSQLPPFWNWLVSTQQRLARSRRPKQKLHPSNLLGGSCGKEEHWNQGNVRRHVANRVKPPSCAMAPDPRVAATPQSLRPGAAKSIPGQSAQRPMKLISSFDAPKSLNANNMETLIECQSEGDIKEHPLLASCESEDNICQLIEVKKRKKVLSWPFLLRRLPASPDFSGALEPELKVSLFDQPLSIICGEDGSLPRPIQDILTILCLKGPSTEGIFRKAASEKARKELKEELNCGGAVDLEGLPVHLLAAVFKDFLRSIPQKLLSCDLFKEWMGALEEQNEEDRIEALKQVAARLPRPNLLLLKHLVYVMHLISKNSELNKMDSSNLAICIGPNMLALQSDQSLSLEAQKDLNNKVNTLVEFLIDNCFEIFGENIPAHSRITSDDSLEHTDSSDVSTLQNDSAYDSYDPDVEPTTHNPSRQPPVPTTTATAGPDKRSPQDAWELGPDGVRTVARLPSSLSQPDRRLSEPVMPPSDECLQSRMAAQKLTKSDNNFAVPQAGPCRQSEEGEDPFPEEVFPAVEGKTKRPADLKIKNSTQDLGPPRGPALEAFSSGSLDGSSESSPVASPSCPKRSFFTRHQSFTSKTEKAKPSREIKKHSMSFSFTSHRKVLPHAPSFGSGKSKDVARDQGKKGWKKESQLAGRIVQENRSDVYSQTAVGLGSQTQGLSAEEVFQLVDQKSPGSPPSYEEAIRCQAYGLTAYGDQTVGSMRARMLSSDTILPPHHGEDSSLRGEETLASHRRSPLTEGWRQGQTIHASAGTRGQVTVPGRSELHRLRTVSKSLQKDKLDYLRRRCSQPIFEADQLQYAKESYI